MTTDITHQAVTQLPIAEVDKVLHKYEVPTETYDTEHDLRETLYEAVSAGIVPLEEIL